MLYDGLSEKQSIILDYILAHTKREGYPPTVREICLAVGLKSTSSVFSHLNKIEECGYIKRDRTKPRAIELTVNIDDELHMGLNQEMIPLPLVGQITAGLPILAEENIEEYYPLPSSLVKGKDDFILRVKGDSMINVGIYDGDLVIIEKKRTASNGTIIAALIDGEEATIKTYYNEGRTIRLQPENDDMEPFIYPAERVAIIGVLRGLFRTY